MISGAVAVGGAALIRSINAFDSGATRNVTLDRELRCILAGLARAIGKNPRAERMILYGSCAKGTNNAESDVDIAVFFNRRSGRESSAYLLEEYRALVRACCNPERDIQIQAFCSDELDDPCGIVEEIVAFGIEVPLLRE